MFHAVSMYHAVIVRWFTNSIAWPHNYTHVCGGVIKYHRLYCYDKCISIKGYDDGFIKAMNLV